MLPSEFQDRRFQPLTHSSVFKYNWQQLLAGRLVTILGSIAAFWCVLSPNCHQNFRVSRPPPSLNRDLYAYNAWLQRLLNIPATSGLSPYQRLARSDAMQQCDAACAGKRPRFQPSFKLLQGQLLDRSSAGRFCSYKRRGRSYDSFPRL